MDVGHARRYRAPSSLKLVYLLGAFVAMIASLAIVFAVWSWVRLDQSLDRAERQARISCERSRAFGPALAVAYRRYKILSPPQLEAYVSTIPKACP